MWSMICVRGKESIGSSIGFGETTADGGIAAVISSVGDGPECELEF